MTTSHSRHIPREVHRQLREEARDRCCLCGRLIPFDEIPLDIEGDILEQHHIIYFAEGGPNTEDNLLIVCPSCHSRIHQHPDRYPREKLESAKRIWKQMKQLVGQTLSFGPDEGAYPSGRSILVAFYVAALNLKYNITVPETVELGSLARFISMWIMHPLVAFANLSPYKYMFGQAQLSRMSLARKSAPETRLDPSLTVADLDLPENDSLVALIDIQWAAAINRPPEEEEADRVHGRVTLTWGNSPRDLDLHLIAVDPEGLPQSDDLGGHVFFGNPGSLSRLPYTTLNVDVRTGFGPEVISLGCSCRGSFLVAVDNYSGETALSESGASVVVEVGEIARAFQCPTSGDGRCWHVCIIDLPAGTIRLIQRVGERPVSSPSAHRGPFPQSR